MKKTPSKIIFVLALTLGSLWAGGCSRAQPTEQPTAQPTASPIEPSTTAPPEPTPTPLPTSTPLPTATPIPIPTEKYQTPGEYLDIITVNGLRRWFTVHIPPGYQPGVPIPLVINLHGRSGTAFQQEQLSQMNAKADEEGFIVVNPQALDDPSTWWGPIPGPVGQADRDFFEEMLAYLQREMSIDPARIYATGMSNGATMTNRLGCDLSDTFAAIAPVSGGHTAFDLCEVDRPVPVLIIHGTEDIVIPYYGRGTDVPPVHVWVEAWAQRDGCDLTPSVSHPHPNITKETWENCDENALVTLYSLEGGGHTWPGAPLSATLGSSFPYMSATDVIWDFFKAHPRPVPVPTETPKPTVLPSPTPIPTLGLRSPGPAKPMIW